MKLGRVIINFGKRGSRNVRFAPKATELPRGSEMTLWAKLRHRPVLFDDLVGSSE